MFFWFISQSFQLNSNKIKRKNNSQKTKIASKISLFKKRLIRKNQKKKFNKDGNEMLKTEKKENEKNTDN